MMRITCSCPEALVLDANQYAMALGFSEADGETYRGLNWQDANGNLYAAASFDARDEWIIFAQAPLVRPVWDTAEIIDMDAAAVAQAALFFWSPNEDDPFAPTANPLQVVVIGGIEGPDALAAMGLTPVETE